MEDPKDKRISELPDCPSVGWELSYIPVAYDDENYKIQLVNVLQRDRDSINNLDKRFTEINNALGSFATTDYVSKNYLPIKYESTILGLDSKVADLSTQVSTNTSLLDISVSVSEYIGSIQTSLYQYVDDKVGEINATIALMQETLSALQLQLEQKASKSIGDRDVVYGTKI